MTDTIDRIHPDLRALALPIDSLHEDPRNANEHNDASHKAIAASFIEFGQRKNLVVRREGMILEAGNGTLAALRAAGWTHLACIVCDDDEQRAIAYGLADNQAARHATWNFGQLRENVEAALANYGEVLGNLWTGDQLANILADKAAAFNEQLNGSQSTPEALSNLSNEIPESPSEPATKLGDIWIMGNHRLICGDCRDPAVVAQLLGNEKINVAFTSPPYASQRNYDESSGFKPIHPDEFLDWFEAVQANVRTHLADDGSWFINIKEHSEGLTLSLYVKELVIAHCKQWNWLFASEYCWERNGMPGYPKRRFKNQFEPVFHFATAEWKFRPTHVQHATESARSYDPANQWAGGLASVAGESGKGWAAEGTDGLAYPGNRLPVFGQGNETNHTASFPIGLPTFFIKAYSDPDDIIFDPFTGSGTTTIAAEREKRRSYGCEISPRYCDVTVKRWENETGRKAERL